MPNLYRCSHRAHLCAERPEARLNAHNNRSHRNETQLKHLQQPNWHMAQTRELHVCTKLATTTVRLDANNTSYTSRPGPLHDQPSPDQEPEKSKERFVSNSDEHRLLLTFDVLSRLCLLIHTSAAVSSHGDYSSLRDGTLPVPIRFCFRGGVFDVIFVFDSIFSTRCVRFLIVRDFSVVGGKLKAVRRCHWLLTFERCVNRSD